MKKPKSNSRPSKNRPYEAYRAFHEQGFIPIFVQTAWDSKMLVTACVEAGYQGIEYTFRSRDAREMIPWIRKTFPDLYLLAGSTLDDDKIVRQMQRKSPQIMTLSEIARLGVDGFVSMLGWSFPSIKKYCRTHVVVPTAMTVTEALQQTAAGAHFIKLLSTDLEIIKRCRGDATFGFCPIMATGGATLERIPQIVAAGAVTIGAGFDLLLKGEPADIPRQKVVELLKTYRAAVLNARKEKWPELSEATGKDKKAWLSALPHYHPF